MAGECCFPVDQQSHRDEKTQGGAALPAVQDRGGARLHDGAAQAADPDRAALQIVNPGPQSREAPAGGPDILGVREAVDDTGPAAGESRRNQQPVGLAFGGRRGDGPPQLCRCNRDVHSATSTKARRPSISRGTVLAWPISSSTTTSMVPPRRFLSPVAASYNSAAV